MKYDDSSSYWAANPGRQMAADEKRRPIKWIAKKDRIRKHLQQLQVRLQIGRDLVSTEEIVDALADAITILEIRKERHHGK